MTRLNYYLLRYYENTQIWGDGNWQNGTYECQRAANGSMDVGIRISSKQDEFQHFSTDLRSLKALTVMKTDSIPWQDECSDAMEEVGILWTLHARSGCSKCWVWYLRRIKLTMSSHEGLYRFITISFGLKKALSSIQREMDNKKDHRLMTTLGQVLYRNFHPFKASHDASEPWTEATGPVVKSRPIAKLKESLIFRLSRKLFWARSSWQPLDFAKRDWCD